MRPLTNRPVPLHLTVFIAVAAGRCYGSRGSPGYLPAVLSPQTPNGTIHCAGQDPISFAAYSGLMASRSSSVPGVEMVYVGLRRLTRSWFVSLRATLDGAPGSNFIIPQIGLALPGGDALNNVSAGVYDPEIAELVAGLTLLGRPAFIRVGYEFNGGWNNYPPKAYIGAWNKIVSAWKADPALNRSVAAVWDYSCDGPGHYMSWYPTETPPDWWGVNIFSQASLASSDCVAGFVDAATAARVPVMLGESTPRGYSVLDAPWAALGPTTGSEAPSWCVTVTGGSTTDSAALVLQNCSILSSSSRWRLNPDGYLVNEDGKCVGSKSGDAVITECGGTDSGPALLTWTLLSSGQLESRGGECLVASDKGPLKIVKPCPTTRTTWSFVETTVGGGNTTWHEWFVPYLDLIANPTVAAFCYIDWFWPAKSNHEGFNWYNWGDARIEHSTLVADQWTQALLRKDIVGASKSETDLCRALHC